MIIESDFVFDGVDEELRDDEAVRKAIICVIFGEMLEDILYFHLLDSIHEPNCCVDELNSLTSFIF